MKEIILKENETLQMYDMDHNLIGSLFNIPNHKVLIESIGSWEYIQLQVDYVLVATYWSKSYELHKLEDLSKDE